MSPLFMATLTGQPPAWLHNHTQKRLVSFEKKNDYYTLEHTRAMEARSKKIIDDLRKTIIEMGGIATPVQIADHTGKKARSVAKLLANHEGYIAETVIKGAKKSSLHTQWRAVQHGDQ